MHAVVGTWTLAASRHREDGLYTEVVPQVTVRPGFVSAYWMCDRETGKGHTTIVLDNEESAHSLKADIEANRQTQVRAGITSDALAVVEVTASARTAGAA